MLLNVVAFKFDPTSFYLFICSLLLCWGYIVSPIKVLTIYQMYQSWIYPLHHSHLSLHGENTVEMEKRDLLKLNYIFFVKTNMNFYPKVFNKYTEFSIKTNKVRNAYCKLQKKNWILFFKNISFLIVLPESAEFLLSLSLLTSYLIL
jgi:hypothetical protein